MAAVGAAAGAWDGVGMWLEMGLRLGSLNQYSIYCYKRQLRFLVWAVKLEEEGSMLKTDPF